MEEVEIIQHQLSLLRVSFFRARVLLTVIQRSVSSQRCYGVLSKYTWPDGAHYEGEFMEGHHSGKGKYTFVDGSVYSGEWKQGQYHGK